MNNETQKNKIISYIYIGLSLMILLVGLYGIFFINKLKFINQKTQLMGINPNEFPLFNIVFVILIIVGLFLMIAAVNMLKGKRWANLFIEIFNWFGVIFMSIFTIGYIYFILNIDTIYNIRNKGVIIVKIGGLFISTIYILIIFLIIYVNKQLKSIREIA